MKALNQIFAFLLLSVVSSFGQITTVYSAYVSSVTTSTVAACHTTNCWTSKPDANGTGFTQLSAASDGSLWGRDSAKRIWQHTPGTSTWVNRTNGLTDDDALAVANATTVYMRKSVNVFQYNFGANTWDQLASTVNITQIAVGADGDLWGVGQTAFDCGFQIHDERLGRHRIRGRSGCGGKCKRRMDALLGF